MTSPVTLGQALQMLTVAGSAFTGVYMAGIYMERLHTDLHNVSVNEKLTTLQLSDAVQTLTDIATILRRCPGPAGRRSEIDWPAQLASRGTGPIPHDPCL